MREIRTPMFKDKRWITVMVTIVLVLGLTALGKEPGEQTLTFLGITLAAFMSQSQWGQTKRAIQTNKELFDGLDKAGS